MMGRYPSLLPRLLDSPRSAFLPNHRDGGAEIALDSDAPMHLMIQSETAR
jgi:hypothetical protein